MKTGNLQKTNILFQSFLHLMLAVVQVLSFAGLPWFMANENSTFYATLAMCAMVAGTVTLVTGVGTASLFWMSGQKDKAILIVFQSAGAFLSVYLYRDYLYKISDPYRYSPARWMLTPYLIALLVGAGMAALYGVIRKRSRSEGNRHDED